MTYRVLFDEEHDVYVMRADEQSKAFPDEYRLLDTQAESFEWAGQRARRLASRKGEPVTLIYCNRTDGSEKRRHIFEPKKK